MWRALYHRARDEEAGVALIISVVLMSVIATLSVTMLSVGSHSDQSSARGRHSVQALHVAESGVERAIARIEETGGSFSGSISGSTEEGSYAVTVTPLSRNRFTIESRGGVRDGRRLGAERVLRVSLEPPSVFRNALFSYTTLETKNNDRIEGDVWANQSVILADGTTVTGSVTAATGYVLLKNGAVVEGEARAGGFDSSGNAIKLQNNAELHGKATASVTAPPDPVTCGGANASDYTVRVGNGALIGGGVSTWGSLINSGTVNGTVAQNVCTTAPATIAMPSFTYASSNYDVDTLHEFGTSSTPSASAVTDFQNYLATNGNTISGTFYINQAAPVGQNTRIDLTNVVIDGDTSIITNTPIFTNGTTDSPNASDVIVLLASTYQPPTSTSCDVNQDNSECAIHIKNNFAVCDPEASEPGTAVLVYAPFGPTAIKNNAIQCGAVYSDSIQVKNNQILEYDARIERLVGFGATTLEVTRWLELSP